MKTVTVLDGLLKWPETRLPQFPFVKSLSFWLCFSHNCPFLKGLEPSKACGQVQQYATRIEITPTAAGLPGMHEYHVFFRFDHLFERPSDEVHIGCQVGKVYRLVLQDHEGVYLLAFATHAKRKSNRNGQRRSPRSWEVAPVPFPFFDDDMA